MTGEIKKEENNQESNHFLAPRKKINPKLYHTANAVSTKKNDQELNHILERLKDKGSVAYNYINGTVFDSIQEHGTKAEDYQRMYKKLTLAGILIGAAVPVVAIFSNAPMPAKISMTVLSSASTAINVVLQTFQYQQVGIAHQRVKKDLLEIVDRYSMNAEPFAKCATPKEAQDMLVEMCEAAMKRDCDSPEEK